MACSHKRAVFREIARVLRPGGRVAVSDIALKKVLPAELAGDLTAYVGCIAGAIEIDKYQTGPVAAGFAHVQVIDSRSELNAYTNGENQSGCCSPAIASAPTPAAVGDGGCCTPKPAQAESVLHKPLASLLRTYDLNDFAASVKVLAVKPK